MTTPIALPHTLIERFNNTHRFFMDPNLRYGQAFHQFACLDNYVDL